MTRDTRGNLTIKCNKYGIMGNKCVLVVRRCLFLIDVTKHLLSFSRVTWKKGESQCLRTHVVRNEETFGLTGNDWKLEKTAICEAP